MREWRDVELTIDYGAVHRPRSTWTYNSSPQFLKSTLLTSWGSLSADQSFTVMSLVLLLEAAPVRACC